MYNVLLAISSSLIILVGIYFTFSLKGIQFNFIKMFQSVLKKNKDGISPIQALMVSLAGRIGVGSIAGVALAIYVGGIGSIFWMWVTVFISAPNTFSETVLGIKYKEKDIGNIYRGGPSYYIKKGLNNGLLAKIYAILILVCYIGGFLGIQSNTITKSVNEIFVINPYIIGVLIAFITALIIYGGIKEIISVTTFLVPIMTILYLLFSVIAIIKHIDIMPSILVNIVKSAFNFKPFFAGFLTTFIIGLQRGIFSNEAGLGTSSISASTTSSNDSTSSGYTQMLGIYITTLLICSATCFIILTSDYGSLALNDINGIEIAQYAFNYHFGSLGTILIFISILLFSFSTIITGYYYGESALKFLIKTNKKTINLLKLITLFILFLGCIINSTLLWRIVDILVCFLIIINMYAIMKLRNVVKKEIN